MPKNARSPANHAAPANSGTACDTHASRNRRVLTDLHVMRDLDEIVELAPITDDCIVERTTINRAVGADFHVSTNLNASQLRNFLPAALVPGKTEAIRADHRSSVNQTAITNHTAMAEGDPRAKLGLRTHHRIVLNDAARTDDGTRLDACAFTTTAPGPTATPRPSVADGAITAEDESMVCFGVDQASNCRAISP